DEYLPPVYWYSRDAGASPITTAAPHTIYTYNAFGEVIQKSELLTTNATTNAYAYTYYFRDELGHVVAQVDPMNYLTKFVYDATGAVTRRVEYAAALSDPNNYANPVLTNP